MVILQAQGRVGVRQATVVGGRNRGAEEVLASIVCDDHPVLKQGDGSCKR